RYRTCPRFGHCHWSLGRGRKCRRGLVAGLGSGPVVPESTRLDETGVLGCSNSWGHELHSPPTPPPDPSYWLRLQSRYCRPEKGEVPSSGCFAKRTRD